MPKTCPTCNGSGRVRRDVSRKLLRSAVADELCGECLGCGVVKGSPEEEREFEQRRQRNRQELVQKGAAERARRREAQERTATENKAPLTPMLNDTPGLRSLLASIASERFDLPAGRAWKAQLACGRSAQPVSQTHSGGIIWTAPSTTTTYKVPTFEVSFDLRKDELVRHTCPACRLQFTIGTRCRRERSNDEMDALNQRDNSLAIMWLGGLAYAAVMAFVVFHLVPVATSADVPWLTVAGLLILAALTTTVFALSLRKRRRLVRSAKAALPSNEWFWRRSPSARHIPYQFAIGSSDGFNHYLWDLGSVHKTERAWAELPPHYVPINWVLPNGQIMGLGRK